MWNSLHITSPHNTSGQQLQREDQKMYIHTTSLFIFLFLVDFFIFFPVDFSLFIFDLFCLFFFQGIFLLLCLFFSKDSFLIFNLLYFQGFTTIGAALFSVDLFCLFPSPRGECGPVLEVLQDQVNPSESQSKLWYLSASSKISLISMVPHGDRIRY